MKMEFGREQKVNDLLDLILNGADYVDDNIKTVEQIKKILEETKELMLKNQAKIIDLYTSMKTEKIKKEIEKQQADAYLKILETDKQINEMRTILNDLQELKSKIQ